MQSLRKSSYILWILMISAFGLTMVFCMGITYHIVLNNQKAKLKELSVNQQYFIRTIYKETGDKFKSLNILKGYFKDQPKVGETVEYLIGTVKNDSIYFLIDQIQPGYSVLPLNTELAEPMKFALEGKTGFLSGKDYHNTKVLAYCTYLPELEWGIVTKMDISEVNKPFYRALFITVIAVFVLVMIGTFIFKMAFNPIVRKIINSEQRYKNLYEYSAIPIIEISISEIKNYFDNLKNSGIPGIRKYIENNNDEVRQLLARINILSVNKASLSFFNCTDKKQIIDNLPLFFTEDSIKIFRNEVTGFLKRNHSLRETEIKTLDGETKRIFLHLSSVPGHGGDRLLMSIVDITDLKKAEELVRLNEAHLEKSQEIAHLGSWELDLETGFLIWSAEVYRIFGLRGQEFKPSYEAFLETIHPDDKEKVNEAYNKSISNNEDGYEIEHRIIRKHSGEIRFVHEKCQNFRNPDGKIIKSLGMVHDITQRKILEYTQLYLGRSPWLKNGEDFFTSVSKYLAECLQLDYVFFARLMKDDLHARTIAVYYMNQFTDNFIYELKDTPCGVLGKNVCIIPSEVRKLYPGNLFLQKIEAESYAGTTLLSFEGKPIGLIGIASRKPLKDSKIVELVLRTVAIRAAGEMEVKKSEKILKETNERLKIALENGKIAVWEWDLFSNKVTVDERMNLMFGFESGTETVYYNDLETLIVDEDTPSVRDLIRKALKEITPFQSVFRIKHASGEINYINCKAIVRCDNEGKPIRVTGVCFDVTEMKEGAERTLFKLNEELHRSNIALEQFAYVASHDLQEPLRMVSSFTQLLEKNYKDKLDDDGREYIRYAVDGAKRMFDMINALLSYSRIQTKGKKFDVVDMNNIVEQFKSNLSLQIFERQASVTADSLPEVMADENQMVQIFQNLVSNSIKFCDTIPRVHISCSSEQEQHVFSVRDNGIGIESCYYKRIFQIFQRLGRRDEYSGTGIGLAICKNIVERHGGEIWLESKPGVGTTFYFSIPRRNYN